MKKEILKIAGVKSEKEFYKKFPDEASFMAKHGKEKKLTDKLRLLLPNKLLKVVEVEVLVILEVHLCKLEKHLLNQVRLLRKVRT